MDKKTNPRPDFTQRAFSVFQQAIGEADAPEELTGKKADSQKGGLKGGKARADKLTPEERSEIAKKAAAARWGDEPKPNEVSEDADGHQKKKFGVIPSPDY
jgi:hypothetical protein